MNVLKSIKAFLKAPQPETVVTAAHHRFDAAVDAFKAASAAMETYTTRANHRYTIRRRAASSTHDTDTYNEVIAGYTDLDDFLPYTDAYLDAHTTAIDNLTAAFDTLTAAFAASNRADHLYKHIAAIYKATTDLYVFATDAYSRAAHCAILDALEGNLRANQNDFEVLLLENKATNETTVNAATTAKAAAFKANAAKDHAAAKRLEHKATEAEARAKALCTKAISAAAN